MMEVRSDGYEPHKFEIEKGSVILSFSGWAALSSKAVDVAKGETAMSHTDSPKPASEVHTKSDGEIGCETSTNRADRPGSMECAATAKHHRQSNATNVGCHGATIMPGDAPGAHHRCAQLAAVHADRLNEKAAMQHLSGAPTATSKVRVAKWREALRIPEASGGDGDSPGCKVRSESHYPWRREPAGKRSGSGGEHARRRNEDSDPDSYGCCRGFGPSRDKTKHRKIRSVAIGL